MMGEEREGYIFRDSMSKVTKSLSGVTKRERVGVRVSESNFGRGWICQGVRENREVLDLGVARGVYRERVRKRFSKH